MRSDPPIGVTVIGGYLGAGKTTLVNHILANADQRIAVMVNDFGEINIDADLIQSRDGETISLANGCICCSLVDGFGVALDAVLKATPRPERLVIEASGVGYPGQIAAFAHAPGLQLDGVITVVDAESIRTSLRSEYIGDVVDQQCAEADLIVLNKVDLVDNAAIVQNAIASISKAPIVEAVNASVPLEILLGLDRIGVDGASIDEADDRFRTWTQEYPDPVDRQSFLEELSQLAKTDGLVRAKGVVRFIDSPENALLVQMVGARVTTIEHSGDGPSTVVFIGLREPV